MKLSIIIPIYNEEKTIKEILKHVLAVDISKYNLKKEIIIVDDGSTDGTRKILAEIENSGNNFNQIKIIYHSKNQGKGSAIRSGLKYTTGDIILIQDADLEYDPNDYYRLIRPILDGKARIVYGSRILGEGKKSYWSFYLGGRFLSFLANLLYNARITDEPTCYKVFRSDVLKGINLKCERFEFCPEVTAKVRKKGYEIFEVPIHYNPRSLEEGKKINWKDGLEAIWTLLKYKFVD